MSYYIDVFVEKKPTGSDCWELVGDGALMESCQYMIINDDDIDRDDIDGDDFEDLDEPISDGLRKRFGDEIDHYIVRQCFLDKYKERCNKCVDAFEDDFRVCYKALGISCELNDGGRILDLYSEYEKQYTDAGNIRKGYNPLTFPIDKRLLIELNNKSARYQKALKWLGLLLHVNTIRNTEYRLVFVRIY